ncbi:MAG: hypothetical protein ACOCXJ_00100 [Planctomycetota bacterium]
MHRTHYQALTRTSTRLIALSPGVVLPASTVGGDHFRLQQAARWAAGRRLLIIACVLCAGLGVVLWGTMRNLRPAADQLHGGHLAMLAAPAADSPRPAAPSRTPEPDGLPPEHTPAVVLPPEHRLAQPALPPGPEPVRNWAPRAELLYRAPADHPPVPSDAPVRVRVVTISAKVTAYTPYDHARSKPEWADGVVAWHPRGRKRHVAAHPYGLATDWGQFPGGSTFIRVPGYMDRSFAGFPEAFRVVDDKCGQSRKARRRGWQPIIDARYLTRYSAISGPNAWGSRQLEVEVIFPDGFRIPADLQRWVVRSEWHTYQDGELVERSPAPLH